ncbi:unnamed protein product [Vicia faba]|uniref:Uncharacterized protein n=1 Tax=Vicia faba TaxID=3906 RepID=A0AAV0Z2F7_VICFA|nr:unnamed protein product [Vicia faba]
MRGEAQWLTISFQICGGGLQVDLQHELTVDGDCDVVWKAWLARVRRIRLQIWVWLASKNGRKVAVGMMRVDERRGSGHAMGEDLIESPSPYYFLLSFNFSHFEILLHIWFRRGVVIAVASLFSSLSQQAKWNSNDVMKLDE